MTLYTPSSWLGDVIAGMTTNITGDVYMTYFFLLIIFALILISLFKLEFEWVAISLSGIIIVLLAYSSEWLALGGLVAIFFAVLVARNWITN